MLLRALCALAACASVARAELDETDYTPIVVPLAVRSPYLGAYLTGREDKTLVSMDPHFWTTLPLGWKGLLRVDGHTWNWMGNLTDWPAATNASIRHTASESGFTLTNDPPTVALHASFLSPVTPADLFRQSIPFSYLHLSAESLDGQAHDVDVYSEVNGLWLADEEHEELEWAVHEPERGTGRDFVGVRARLKHQRPFEEAYHNDLWSDEWVSTDRILQGDLWYAAQDVPGSTVRTTFAAGDDAMTTRRLFAESGSLRSVVNTTQPRPTRTRRAHNASLVLDEPVFALAHSFGRISPASPPEDRSALVAIGHVRDPLVQYMTGTSGHKEVVALRPLWASTFVDVAHLVGWFLVDYPTAKRMSDEFNAKLYADARAVESQEYAHVVAVSTRQIFMALEAVWDESVEGRDAREGLVTWSPLTGEPVPTMIMLKEISSNGNCQTVDVIAPILPFLLYASPTLIPLLLEPIHRYMASGLYVPVPPTHDLGDHYPNATAHNDFLHPNLPIEEAGNALCLQLAGMRVADPSTAALSAHERVSHWVDKASSKASSWAGRNKEAQRVGWEADVGVGKDHRREGARMARAQARERYALLKKWADYLEEESLYPGDQRTTDDFFGSAPNQTSLVVKGIMGLRAMSEIASDLGETADRDYYLDVSNRFRDTFLDMTVSKDGTHILGTYNNQSSWVTHYNLYFDKLFDTKVFPDSVYRMLDAFYPTVAQPYGPPLDSRFPDRAKTDWLAWAAALFPRSSPSSSSSRTLFLDALARYFRQDRNAVFGDSITPDEGWSVGFLSRPVAGGHYSLLGLAVLAQARADAAATTLLSRSRSSLSQSLLALAALVALTVVALVGARGVRRCVRRRSGYVELGGGRRRAGSRGASRVSVDGVWGVGSPRSVFELAELEDEGDEGAGEGEGEEESWRLRRPPQGGLSASAGHGGKRRD
ncbi:uncharacterized protein RHOBADRAFT_53710 [Rhodotorula graminis WP1]|uniref:Uncharacterized protein n=1 Tax=Rhodotorula graminis (strain WP1) TaxID=578459 RepID=A0A194S5R7_RHOGW|nr:uncharacterized protein RHOBADRAFT_53710 [Rhodotorula graminis WP1]KPV74766.1 hypothetical protein RHOBADRAFT_53710 [Rhodotorula graminis WP1]